MKINMIKFSAKKIFIVVLIVSIIFFIGLVWWNFIAGRVNNLPDSVSPAVMPETEKKVSQNAPLAVSVAKGLEIPWALDFLFDGSIIFTERSGRVRLIDTKDGLLQDPLLTISDVAHVGEGGLLGIAVHPDFVTNRFIYVYYTYKDGENLVNRVVRFKKRDKSLGDEKIIIDGIPGAANHNGGRIKFGPDGFLYVSTGDARIPDLAQNKNSLAGKILRLKDDGGIPSDNPFPDSPVYSIGHRNPQGMAWDASGRLWITEHGPKAADEVNLIKPGKNYGWPIVRGDERAAGFEAPVIHSGKETWAPSGAAFYDDSLFFAGLRGQSLYGLATGGESPILTGYLNKNFGRLRNVVTGPDNFLYILTSNQDGRGIPTADDDQIIRINPEKLFENANFSH